MSKGKVKKSGVPTETAEQRWLIQWSQQPSIRSIYPELALLYHIPNERTDKVQASILKATGVKAGVPDLHLPVPAGSYHGLFIEMKSLDGKIMWYIIDKFKPMWAGLSCGKYVTVGVSALFAFCLSFGYHLDLMAAFGVAEHSVIGTVLTALTLMGGSSAVSELIGKIKQKPG